jgi:SAM-dependent methyltransferase
LSTRSNKFWELRAIKAVSRIERETEYNWQPESGYLKAIGKLLLHNKQTERELRTLKTDLWNEGIDIRRDILTLFDSNRRFSLYATDISEVTCRRAKKRLKNTAVVNADIRRFPFRNESIDIILDLSTIDHVTPDEISKVISEYHRALRDQSLLLLFFWHEGMFLKLLRKLKPPSDCEVAPYRYYLRIDEMRTLLRSHGFDLLNEYCTLGFGKESLTRAGKTSMRFSKLVYAVVLYLEYSVLSRIMLRPFGGLYAVIGRKNKAL